MPWPDPITLRGRHAVLEPLSADHQAGLAQASRDGDVWQLWYTAVAKPEGMGAEIERRLGLQRAGSMLPFAVRSLPDNRLVGMTTYMNVDATNRRVEIGSTWYGASVRRSALNTECKRMLLAHAFEQLDCIAVEFRTHFMNHQSRRAIERLGARLDGILRHHQRLADGTLRDTCVYSITAPEWPTVRRHLDWQLERPRGEAAGAANTSAPVHPGAGRHSTEE